MPLRLGSAEANHAEKMLAVRRERTRNEPKLPYVNYCAGCGTRISSILRSCSPACEALCAPCQELRNIGLV